MKFSIYVLYIFKTTHRRQLGKFKKHKKLETGTFRRNAEESCLGVVELASLVAVFGGK